MNHLDQLNEKYCYGQMMIKRKGIGKPEVAYIVTHTAGYDTLIKMAYQLPYKYGDKHFFVHITNLTRLWSHAKEGVQIKIFNS